MFRPAHRVRVVAAALSCVAAAAAAVLAAPAAATPLVAAAAAPTLAPGQTLASGASLFDASTGQRLTMQSNGDAVLTYVPAARVLWSTRTSVPGSILAFRSTGDLKVVTPAGAVVWHAGTSAASGSVLSFDPCGRLGIAPQWTSGACTVAGGALFGSRTSSDGRSRAVQQSDGNLVVTTTAGGRGTRVLWSSKTSGAVTAVLQGDQNFVLYRGTTPLWSTRTGRTCAGCTPPVLTIQSDGNFVLYPAAGGAALWSTGTTTASWNDPSLLMTSSSLGPVRVGMTVAQARAAAAVPLDDDAPVCRLQGTTDTATHRSFAYDTTGRVTAVMSGNSSAFGDRTAAGITATSTGDDVLRAYGSAARSYTDIYGTFNVLVRTADGNELRFEMFDGRTGPVSFVQAGVPSVVEQTEICG